MAGVMWRELTTRVIKKKLAAGLQRTKHLHPSRKAKNRLLFRFGRITSDAAGELSPPRQWIRLISSRPSSICVGLARYRVGWPWAELSLCRDRASIVARAGFCHRVDNLQTRKKTNCAARSRWGNKKNTHTHTHRCGRACPPASSY